jgi:hypothetical protein
MRGKRWWPEMGSRGREHSVMLWHGPGAGWKGGVWEAYCGIPGEGGYEMCGGWEDRNGLKNEGVLLYCFGKGGME